jgi:hypothetical protein
MHWASPYLTLNSVANAFAVRMLVPGGISDLRYGGA